MKAILIFLCISGVSKIWALDQPNRAPAQSIAPSCETDIIEDLRQLKLGIASDTVQKNEVASKFREIYRRCPTPGVLLWAASTLTNPVSGALLNPDEIMVQLGINSRIISNGLVAGQVRRLQPHSDLLNSPFRRLFQSIFFSDNATHTFLGVHEGRYVFATNHHVFSTKDDCPKVKIRNSLYGASRSIFVCDEVIYSNPNIDLTIYTVKFEEMDGPFKYGDQLNRNGLAFDFTKTRPSLGTPLVTAGWGVNGLDVGNASLGINDWKNYVPSFDDSRFCVGISDQTKKIADPDVLHYSAKYQVWSWPIGCMSSGGDSGSPVVDKAQQRIQGMIWTTGSLKLLISEYDAFHPTGENLWKRYSYAVPATVIQSYLKKELSTKFETMNTRILSSILKAGMLE